jgi:transposase
MIFVEYLNLIMLSRGMLGKHCLDASWGQFFTILEQTCLKYGVYFQKVNANKTSQTCPNCLTQTGKKQLSERTHSCSNCGYMTDRDVAAAQVVLIRGLAAVGHTACDAFLQVNSSESLRRNNPHAFRLGYVNRGTMGVDGKSSIDLFRNYAAAINSLG